MKTLLRTKWSGSRFANDIQGGSYDWLFRSIFLLGLTGFAGSLKAQDETKAHKNIQIASPNAASLGKYGDIPVSYHSGTPNIDIPIYTVEEGPLKLPISLSYHASGLKVMEQSSWVGAGWSLNAGGVITRTVRGFADEKAFADTYYLQDGGQGFYSYLYSSFSTPQKPMLDYSGIIGGIKDTEPDLFFFNFGGYSGKFYFRADHTPVIVPQQDIRIDPHFCPDNASNCSPTNEKLYGFTVITPDGIKYHFGKNINSSGDPAVERTLPYSPTTGLALADAKIISAWYLYRVESPDSRFKIDLSYAKEEYSFYTVSMYPVLSGNGGMNLAKSFMFGQRLSSIAFSNGTVNFIPDPGPREDLSGASTTGPQNDNSNVSDPYPAKGLSQIQITSPALNKVFELTKSYFVDNTPLAGTYGGTLTTDIQTDKKRLKLDKITEKSYDGSVAKPPYVFTYWDEGSVPRTLSLAQDHWGFFNGATANTTLVPNTATDGGWVFTTGGAERGSAFPSMRAGALKKITYPTGGTNEFTYGSHKVFVNKNYYTSSSGWFVNATGSNNSANIYTIVVNSPTIFKYRGRYQNGGSGTAYFGPNVLGSTNWNFTLILMQAGTYTFRCVAGGGNNSQGIEAELYQLNKYTNLETVLVGGLRIETLKTTDGSGANDIVQTFDYTNNNNQDQGVLFGRPNYIGVARNDRMAASGIATGYVVGGGYSAYASDGCKILDPSFSDTPKYFVTPGSLHPMRTTQGGHFGYNQVKVSQTGAGYSVYQYKLEPNLVQDVCVTAIDKMICDPQTPNFPGAPDPIDFSRGELRRVYVFDSGNTMLKETHYESTYVPEPIGVHGLIVKSVDTYFYATEYEIKTSKKTKSTTLEFVYDPANPSQAPIGKVTEVNFNSAEHSLETSTVVSEVTGGFQISNITKGKVLSEVNKQYVPDFLALTTANTSCDPGSYVSAYQSSVNSVCTNDYYNLINSGNCNAVCKFDAWQVYTYCLNEKRKAYIISKKSYADNYLSCLTTKANAATPDLKVLYDLKIRNQIDPVIESYIKRDGKFLKSSYNTYYDVGSNRIDLSPVKMETINQDPQFSVTFAASIGNGTTITKPAAYSTEETYSYANGVLAGIVPKNGVEVSYLWGYNQNYPVAEIRNAPAGSVAYTSFEESTNGGGWSYTFTNSGEHKSGNKAHLLNSSAVVRNGLASGTTYTLSYWAKGGAPFVSAGVVSSNDAPAAGLDGWQYFEKTITGVTSITLNFSGPNIYLDEVKIFPKGALMTTYSYDPLVGIITQTDPNGATTSYRYDPLGRLQYTIDKDGYVVQKLEYAYKTH